MAGWAALMVIVPLGIGMIFAMLSPMLVDIGWSLEAVGFTLNIVGSLVGLLAVFGAGFLIRRFGRKRMLVAAAFAQATIILAVLPLAGGARDTLVILPGLVLVFLIYNPIATVMLTIVRWRAAKALISPRNTASTASWASSPARSRSRSPGQWVIRRWC